MQKKHKKTRKKRVFLLQIQLNSLFVVFIVL